MKINFFNNNNANRKQILNTTLIQNSNVKKGLDNFFVKQSEIIGKKYENKLIMVTQYYILNTENLEYNLSRQKEINYCLIKNCENKFIYEIHLLVEKMYNLTFIPKNLLYKIKQIVINKRLNYELVFEYYNRFISNSYCVLLNSDIYLNETISNVKYINFNKFKILLALNRYEDDISNDKYAIIPNGILEDAKNMNNSNYLDSYQVSIFSQDCWIWKCNKIDIPENCNFNLGINGCDNHIAYLFKNIGYFVLNLSKFICINHYDRLSIINNNYGKTKGNVSKKKAERVGDFNSYLFLENLGDIPDKYTTNIEYIIDKTYPFKSNIHYTKNVSEVIINSNNIELSSEYVSKISIKIKNTVVDYWSILPYNINKDFIECNFNNVKNIVYIDLYGKNVSRFDRVFAGVNKLKIEYLNIDNEWVNYHSLIECFNVRNGNCINRFYFDNVIKCKKIRLYVIDFIGINLFNFKLYKLNDEDDRVDNDKITTLYKNIDITCPIKTIRLNNFNMIYLDNHWEDVTPTEKQVFELFKTNQNLPYNYFAFPWSKYRDNEFKNDRTLNIIIDNIIQANNNNKNNNIKYFTVCLHESFVMYLDIFKLLNIKYIFASQKTKDNSYEHIVNGTKIKFNLSELENMYDIKILPFSLHPYQNSRDYEIIPINERKYITNFIGQYDKKHYISDIREKIFETFEEYNDCYIVKRTTWHYQGIVYGNEPNTDLNKELEYKDLLNNSIFTLCPSGSGSNSIRIWEALSFGSIPVILADTLELPDINDDWKKYVVFWEENNIKYLYNYLKNMNINKKNKMSQNCIHLYNTYFCPEKMNRTIIEYFENISDNNDNNENICL